MIDKLTATGVDNSKKQQMKRLCAATNGRTSFATKS
jgi:hypothetical protein